MGKAAVIGYLVCLVLNVMVCILSFGFFTQPEMAHLNDPALAQIVGKGVGDWARIFVNISVIIAVAGAWLVSTIIASELPAQAAKDHVPVSYTHLDVYKRQPEYRDLCLETGCTHDQRSCRR